MNRVLHLADVRPLDLSKIMIEDNAPMNPAQTPPRVRSKFVPLLERMAPGQSVVLETQDAKVFLKWLRKQGVRAAQSKITPQHMRVKILEKQPKEYS